MKTNPFKILLWATVALVGASAVGGIALHRGESINALWFIAAALCTYAIAYRFYAAWIAATVLSIDPSRATPAERLSNGRDYVPTHRWIVFGHHFAAIAGPGPLVGPTLAAQFGYLPGTLWILFGAVLGGCVQDMVTLFFSMRRDGKSLGQMARDELGAIGGSAALIATFLIMIILIAVLGLVVVNAMKNSPWATSTVAATIPIATRHGDPAGTRHHLAAPRHQDASADPIHRWQRADLWRQTFPLRVHHHCLRRDLGFPRANRFRHHTQITLQ
jgi:carbon starvation protein